MTRTVLQALLLHLEAVDMHLHKAGKEYFPGELPENFRRLKSQNEGMIILISREIGASIDLQG